MCSFKKTARPLALASILMSLLQIAVRFLMSDHALYVQSLTDIWALTRGGPYKWVASQEVLQDMEGLADYVDALAAADMGTGTNFHLMVALGAPGAPGAPVSDSVLADHAAFMRYLTVANITATELPAAWNEPRRGAHFFLDLRGTFFETHAVRPLVPHMNALGQSLG